MKLKQITLKNFRSFMQPKIIKFITNYTVLTGENNCGKSNILRALNLFFNDIVDTKSFDSSKDMHMKTIQERGRERTTITAILDLDEKKDRYAIQKLEKMKNTEIIPEYNINNLQLTCTYTKSNSSQVQYIDPSSGKRTQSREITDFFEKILRKSINFVYIPSVKDLGQFIDKDVSYELLKRVFNTWGRGRNPRAQELKDRFKNIRSSIKEIIDEASDNVTNILKEQNPQIKDFIFNLPFDEIIDFLSYLPITINDGVITDISQKGSGLQALTLYSVLRYLDRYKATNKYSSAQFIWAIEEPETFLHPRAQKQLYHALQEYSNDTQIIVTTHSYHFLNTKDVISNKLLKIVITDDGKYIQTDIVKEEGNYWQPFIEILGDYTPSFIPTSDHDKTYLFLEGNLDKRYVVKALSFNTELKNFYDENIILVDGKGNELPKRANDALNIFKLRTFVLVDGDKKGRGYHEDLTNKGFHSNVNLFKIEKPGFQDTTIEIIVARQKEEEFKTTMPPDALEYWYRPRTNLPLFDAINQRRPPNGWDESSLKAKLCSFMEDNGDEDDFSELTEYLKTIMINAKTF